MKYFSKSEQRLSIVLIMIAVIFIISSGPRIIIMMYDVIIIDTIKYVRYNIILDNCKSYADWVLLKPFITSLLQVLHRGGPSWGGISGLESFTWFCISCSTKFCSFCQLHRLLLGGEQVQVVKAFQSLKWLYNNWSVCPSVCLSEIKTPNSLN